MLKSLEQFAGVHVDAISFTISLLFLLGYQAYLRIRLRKNPLYTAQALNNLARTAWVENVMAERRDILAVQTLRNSTMAASFLASTAILLILGALSLSAQSDKLGEAWHSLNVLGTREVSLWMAKLLLITLDLFVAFFSFSLSIRVYNHVGYLVNVPLTAGHKAISPAHVAEFLNRGGKYYSVGQRAFYYLVPLVFWLFGPLFMVAITILLIAVLYQVDRAPRALEQDYR